MTHNQIIKRIREICLAHLQVKNFYYGLPTDFLTNKETEFESVFLQDLAGTLDLSTKTDTTSFKIYFLDLVNVSEDSKTNEVDVMSDMKSIAKDILAEMNSSSYTDWKVSTSNVLTFLREKFDDLVAGVVVDVSILQPWNQDTCVVPTNELP